MSADIQRKNIALLGATGSIGRQTLDIITANPERYRVTVLAAGSRVGDLIALARVHRPALAIIAREDLYQQLRWELEPLGIACAAGPKALAEAVERPDVDMVVTATVGYSGLEPTIHAIRAGKDIALANKETLVVAGEYITRLLAESPSRIYPVDSEHSAIYQCLQGEDPTTVKRLIITASGGPFRTWDAARTARATVTDALKHPNWSMGAKITVDSATMINKAFEIIEAHWLYGIPVDRIAAVVHPQSIVHSMVEFCDGAVKAQLGIPDMHLPIAYALGCAERYPTSRPALTLAQMANLTFERPDEARFPCLSFANTALERGGNLACTINGANEVAVAAFLRGAISFSDIYKIISRTADEIPFISQPDYADYVATNAQARRYAESLVNTTANSWKHS